MATSRKNFICAENPWLIHLDEGNSADIDIYLSEENQTLREQNQKLGSSQVIGILPIRNAVAFPGTVTPLAIGRQRSKALLKETIPNESIIGLVTQRDSGIEKPGFKDLYTIGTAATVLKIIKMPQGSAHIVVHAINRFRILKSVQTTPYLKEQQELVE